jgi:phenylacetate-CoA ligase
MAENNLVEIVRESGEPAAVGETGYVVVTNLLNRSMPLIRYRLGDLAVPRKGPCSCGRGLPLLQHVQGRSADVITAPNGKLLHGEFFTHLFYDIPGVKQFRVEQIDLRRLMIEVVPGMGFRTESLESLVDAIHEHADRDFIVEYALRDALPASNSGKFRFTTSRIAPILSKESIP